MLLHRATSTDTHVRCGVRTLNGVEPSKRLTLQFFLFNREIYLIRTRNKILCKLRSGSDFCVDKIIFETFFYQRQILLLRFYLAGFLFPQ